MAPRLFDPNDGLMKDTPLAQMRDPARPGPRS